MRNWLLVILICVVCFSCHQQEDRKSTNLKGYSLRKIKLINYCGTISMYLPDAMDTTFQFRDRGDNEGADEMFFRIASRKFSIRTQFNSFPIPGEPDSLYQLTISQKVVCLDGKTYKLDSNSFADWPLKVKLIYGRESTGRRYFQKINGRNFIIGKVSSNYWNKRPNEAYEEYKAFTLIDKQMVTISFTAYKKDTTGFSAEVNKSLQTIEITPDTSITNKGVSYDMKQRGIEYIIYGTYIDNGSSGIGGRLHKMNQSCLLDVADAGDMKGDEKYGSELRFTTDTVNDTYYKNDKPLLDSIPDMILNSDDKDFGGPDPKKMNVVFLQIKINGKLKTFHFNEAEAKLPKEVRRYTELIKGYHS